MISGSFSVRNGKVECVREPAYIPRIIGASPAKREFVDTDEGVMVFGTAYEAAPVDRHRPTRHRPVSPRRPGLDAQPVPQLGHRRAGVMQHDDPAATGVRVHVDHSRSTAQERDPRGGIADLGQLLQFDVQATDGAVCLDDVPTSPRHQAVAE